MSLIFFFFGKGRLSQTWYSYVILYVYILFLPLCALFSSNLVADGATSDRKSEIGRGLVSGGGRGGGQPLLSLSTQTALRHGRVNIRTFSAPVCALPPFGGSLYAIQAKVQINKVRCPVVPELSFANSLPSP